MKRAWMMCVAVPVVAVVLGGCAAPQTVAGAPHGSGQSMEATLERLARLARSVADVSAAVAGPDSDAGWLEETENVADILEMVANPQQAQQQLLQQQAQQQQAQANECGGTEVIPARRVSADHLLEWKSESWTCEDVAAMVKGGANVNARNEEGWSPLAMAAADGHLGTMEGLLAAGANVHARDKNGGTPLHYAAEYGKSPAVVQALLEAGANVHARDEEGWSPLELAAAYGESPGVVRALLAGGANVNARDEEHGATPLHYAARDGNSPGVAKALLAAGADINARDKEGKTPCDWDRKYLKWLNLCQ